MKILSTQEFVGGAKITGIPVATAAGEPVPFEQLNSLLEGLAPKDSVRVATLSNVNLAAPGSTLDGITMAVNDRVGVIGQTTTNQNGGYIYTGAASPMVRSLDMGTASSLEAAVFTVEEGTSAGATFRQTSVNFILGTDPVVFIAFGTSAPAASYTVAGISELATLSEVNTITTDNVVTASILGQWNGHRRRYVTTVGDGSALQYDVTHTFGSFHTIVTVIRSVAPYDTVSCDVSRPDNNNVRLNFAAAPTSNQYIVIIQD